MIPVYAQDEDVNLENLPAQLATHWGISEFAAGLFLSSLLTFAFILPTMILVKRSMLGIVFVGFALMAFCISVGWMPYWIMLMLALLVASMFAGKITRSL